MSEDFQNERNLEYTGDIAELRARLGVTDAVIHQHSVDIKKNTSDIASLSTAVKLLVTEVKSIKNALYVMASLIGFNTPQAQSIIGYIQKLLGHD
jgi:hypothetical protein